MWHSGVCLRLGSDLYHSSVSEISLRFFRVCAAHAQLGGEPRTCVSSSIEIEGFPFPALFSLGFSQHSLASKVPFSQFLWLEKWIFSRTFSPPSPYHIVIQFCVTGATQWGEAARKKNNGNSSNTLHTRGPFSQFHWTCQRDKVQVSAPPSTLSPQQCRSTTGAGLRKRKKWGFLCKSLRGPFPERGPFWSSGQKEWDFCWSLGCPPLLQRSVTQRPPGHPYIKSGDRRGKKETGISLVLVILQILTALPCPPAIA